MSKTRVLTSWQRLSGILIHRRPSICTAAACKPFSHVILDFPCARVKFVVSTRDLDETLLTLIYLIWFSKAGADNCWYPANILS